MISVVYKPANVIRMLLILLFASKIKKETENFFHEKMNMLAGKLLTKRYIYDLKSVFLTIVGNLLRSITDESKQI